MLHTCSVSSAINTTKSFIDLNFVIPSKSSSVRGFVFHCFLFISKLLNQVSNKNGFVFEYMFRGCSFRKLNLMRNFNSNFFYDMACSHCELSAKPTCLMLVSEVFDAISFGQPF